MLGPILMVVLFLVMRLIVWLSLRDVTSYGKTRKSGKSIPSLAITRRTTSGAYRWEMGSISPFRNRESLQL